MTGEPKMITFKKGDILREDVEAIVNTVNCVGVMGRGIALQFKKAYPANFKAYAAACRREDVQPGRMFLFETGQLANPKYIVNFPTKRHWRGKSRLEDIESGLVDLAKQVRARKIRSIAIPPLGSGLGGMVWADVRPLIEAAMRELDEVRVVIFEPNSAPSDARGNRSTEVPKMTAGRAALVELVHQYQRGLLDPYVTLLEVHKLMYFMQVAGEPLKLRYVKGPFGPYAENLRHVLSAIEGHLVTGYADGGDAPDKPIELVPGALEDAQRLLKEKVETQTHFARVSELVAGFESPFGLELLATVHWVVVQESARREDDVVGLVHAWNERKRQFTKRQIGIALDVLSQQRWIEASLERTPVG
jgi:O-acetyl-ADP-ribose deacetylase (regulator of RNase III)